MNSIDPSILVIEESDCQAMELAISPALIFAKTSFDWTPFR